MNDLADVMKMVKAFEGGLLTHATFKQQCGMTLEQAYDWIYGR